MSLTRIWIHCVWATKIRLPLLERDIRTRLFDHIIEKALDKSIDIVQIGGWNNHVHVLIKIHPCQNLASLIHSVKGESSSWMNKEIFKTGIFAWQDAYYAESISFKDLKSVKRYIKNQESHHSQLTYLEELKRMKKND